MRSLLGGWCFLFTLLFVYSCKERPVSELERVTELERSALVSPREQADSLLKQAKAIRNDSLSHYIGVALQARDYGAAEQFDSSSVLLLKVAGFCRRQQPSKRLSNLLAYVENTMGSNILYSTSSAEESSPSPLLLQLSRTLNGIASRDASEMAAVAYKKALDYSREAGNGARIPLVYYNLSMIYSGNGEPATAAYYCRRALLAADSVGWSDKQAAFLYLALGENYVNLHDFVNGKKALDKGAKVYALLPHEDREMLFRNYAKISSLQGRVTEAIVYFRKALKEAEQSDVGEEYSYYSILLQYVDCSIDAGNELPRLKNDLDAGESFFHRLGDRDNELYAGVLRLKLALKERHLTDAGALVSRLLAGGVETKATTSETKLAWYKNLDAYYRMKGELSKAYPAYQKAVALDDSIRGFAQKQYVANLSMSYRQDTTLLNNKIEDERQESEIRTLSWKYLTATMAGVIVLIGFAGYFLYNRRRRNLQHQRYLANMNCLKMQNIRNCISPHFTFNLLNREILLSPGHGEVYERLMNLARLLRRSLDATSHVAIPLSQELDFTQAYVTTLQECGKTFRFHLDVADSVRADDVLIPSMIVQIPVENAVKHGFKTENPDEDRELAITVTDKGSGIDIEIVNNGESYTPFERRKGAGKGIGMQVIYQSLLWLNMKNKEKITFTISDRSAEHVKGTRVSIYVPYHFDFSA